MNLIGVTYEEAKGKFYRSKGWGTINGSAYISPDNELYYSGSSTKPYRYPFREKKDWEECSEDGSDLIRYQESSPIPVWQKKILLEINRSLDAYALDKFIGYNEWIQGIQAGFVGLQIGNANQRWIISADKHGYRNVGKQDKFASSSDKIFVSPENMEERFKRTQQKERFTLIRGV